MAPLWEQELIMQESRGDGGRNYLILYLRWVNARDKAAQPPLMSADFQAIWRQ